MTISRRLDLPVHGLIEFLTGLVMLAAPAILGFGSAGLVVSACLGAVVAGMGLILSAHPHDSELAWHGAFDHVFAPVTALAACALAIAGHGVAAVFLAAIVIVLAVLNLATRYSS